RFEAALWQTTSVALYNGSRAVLVDPGIDVGEVDAIAAAVKDAGAEGTHLLITHADWGHIAGIAAFPGAAAPPSAAEGARITDGKATDRLAEAAKAYDMTIGGWPRCDGILVPGQVVDVGGIAVQPVLCSGHTPAGLAFLVRELGLLALGDHVSPA